MEFLRHFHAIIHHVVAGIANHRRQAVEKAAVDQQLVRYVARLSESEIAPSRLVELVDVSDAREIDATRPCVEGLMFGILLWRHHRHRLNDILSNVGVRPLGRCVCVNVVEVFEPVPDGEDGARNITTCCFNMQRGGPCVEASIRSG
ncbi:hypothetical protein D3C72_857620 [compost metagenome]